MILLPRQSTADPNTKKAVSVQDQVLQAGPLTAPSASVWASAPGPLQGGNVPRVSALVQPVPRIVEGLCNCGVGDSGGMV